jgi:SAM-dependent methyltransferase
MDLKDYKVLSESNNYNSYFWYKSRLNLINNIFFSVFSPDKKLKILDIGCGTGAEIGILEKFGEVIVIDINPKALEIAKEKNPKIKVILGNVEEYDLGKNLYDVVCCFDILEHLREDEKGLEQIKDSLKEGGHLFFTVPAYSFLFSSHDIAMSHYRRYNKREITDKLAKIGFKILKISYWNFFLFFPIFIFRMSKKLFIKLGGYKNSAPKSDARPVNKYLNNFLFSILDFENNLMAKGMKMPFGLTIYGIIKK